MMKVLAGLFVVVFLGAAVNGDGQQVDEKFTVQNIDGTLLISLSCNDATQGIDAAICQLISSMNTNSASSTSLAPNASPTTTQSSSPLEQAHWCQFNNGSYLSRRQAFLYNACSVCQCTDSHLIRCAALTCMTSYCIDGSTPAARPGQCCSQCAYEGAPAQCIVNGIPFPHGTVIAQSSDGLKCWCELGSVECRKASSSALSSLDYWGKGTAIYVIVIVICVVVILGTLLCLGSGLFFYYYYKRDQQVTQQAYEQYYTSAGWQPMGADGQVVDPAAEEKKAEAEQYQYEYEGENAEYIPPPYAVHNSPYASEYYEQGQKS